MCPQGEQCNIVPDNVDDIVADIAQEEKEEGMNPVFLIVFTLSVTHRHTHTQVANYYSVLLMLSIL